MRYLDDFCHAIGKLSSGEGLEERSVDEYIFWLPKRADEILSVRRVDRGFASNTGIHHREESGRDLDEAHASHAAKWIMSQL